MATQNMEVEEARGSEGEDEGGETQRALGSLQFLTQNAEPSGTTSNPPPGPPIAH